jgi:Transcription factor WhiB
MNELFEENKLKGTDKSGYFYQYIPVKEEEWKLEAACQGIDTEIFFVENGKYSDHQSEIIKRMCNGCSVKVECLAYAIKYDMYGMWAGTSRSERKKLSRLSRPSTGATVL